MVRGERPRPALAADARPVRDPRLRGDAAADAGRARRAAVPRLARALAERRRARRGAARRTSSGRGRGSATTGARVSLHRAAQVVAADGWPDDLTALPGVGRYTADAIRSFALGEAVLPVDTNVARVQERTGHRFGPECGAGADGPRRDGLPRARSALRRVPARRRLPLARAALRAGAQAGAARGLVPAAARAHAAARRRRAARVARARRRGGRRRSSATGSCASTTASSACRTSAPRTSATACAASPRAGR